MLNVLIVDDEPFIRQGLRVLVDWEAEGFHIIGEAADGLEALEMLDDFSVNLVIADIQMPGMGGLQLLQTIREKGMNDLHFVILSGFREFGYAQSAMKYGCYDYIVKPINSDDLLRLLRGISEKCEQRQLDEAEEQLRDSAMLERNLLPLIGGKYDEINLSYVREHLKLSSGVRYINVELDMSDHRLHSKTEAERRGMQRKLYAGLRALLGKRANHIIFDVNKSENCYDVGMVYCSMLAQEQSMTEQQYFAWLAARAEAVVECRTIIQVGSEVDSLENLSESYRSASIAKFMQDFQENGTLCVADQQRMKAELPSEAYGEMKRRLDAVVTAIEQCGRTEIELAVDALYRYMGESQMDPRFINMNISYILFQLIHMAMERDNNLDQQEAVNYLIENAFDKGVVRGSAAHFSRFCCEYADYLAQINTQNSTGILAQVEREIAEHYMTNISLKQLGERLFINSAYLGQLFKKHFGMSFKDYLNMVRINNSAELLAHTDMKVYEVSEAVGYQSVDYFINKFCTLRGHTPTQYRKNVRQSGR